MLNKLLPFGEVHGLPGVFYEQNGQYYGANGMPAVGHPIENEPPPPEEVFVPGLTCIEQPTFPEDAVGDGHDLENMHWRHLKALVETYGGEYTDKKSAINFMVGKQ